MPNGSAGTPTNWGAANWGAFQWSGTVYATEQYLYDGAALVAEYDGSGTLLRRYVPGAGVNETAMWYEGANLSSPHWLMTDERGSVIAASDASGAATLYTYSVTGEPGGGWGANPSTPIFRYTGQAALAAVGLYDFKARMYDPALGRFLQADPAGYDAGMNLYAYAGNDLANATDPSGLDTDDIETVVVMGKRIYGQDISFQDAIDFLQHLFNFNIGPDTSIPENKNANPPRSGTNSPHGYDDTYKVCKKGWSNCNPDEVYKCLRENPAPFVSGAPVNNGQDVNIPLFGPMTVNVSPQNRTIVNSTLPNHELYPGGVIRSVVENDNWIGINNTGFGNGPYGGLNTAFAPWLWSWQTTIQISGCVVAGK